MKGIRVALLALLIPLIIAIASVARGLAAALRRQPMVGDPDIPPPEASLGLATAIAVDTLITLPMGLLASTGTATHYWRASAELDAAVATYDAWGWLDDPGRRHVAPPAPTDAEVRPGRAPGLERLHFTSGWQPEEGEPGGDRWRSFTANQDAAVTLLRHGGRPRPWLVAVHGQGMGRPSDVRMLGAQRLHEELGINVAMPVLPLHGPRSAGLRPDQQFVTNVYLLNNVFGLTQAVWDLRRLLTWLRDVEDAPAIGVLGVSLGSYVCSVLATLVSDLACVVAMVPTSDLAAALRAAEPSLSAARRRHRALHDERSDAVHRLVSPMARPCLVPHDRRFIVAGQVDRIASPAGAAALWRHWDEPAIRWTSRGHVTSFRSHAYDDHIAVALRASGLHDRREATCVS